MVKTNAGLKAQLQVAIDMETAIWINDKATKLSKTVPDIVRQIINEYIARHTTPQEKQS